MYVDMEKYSVVVFSVSVLFIICSGEKLPSSFKTCKRDDPSINQCMQIAISDALLLLKDGIPVPKVSRIEPLNVPSVTIGEGTGPVNVVQNYRSLDIHNVTITKIDSVEAHVGEPFKIKINLSGPECILTADYDFNGRILLLPIVGVGKCTIKLVDLKSEIVLIGEKTVKKGVTYMKIKDFKILLNPGRVYYNFENLFNGDPRLGKEMNNVLNESWKEVFDDVKPGYEEFIGSIGKHVAKSIFLKVPYDDLFPPK